MQKLATLESENKALKSDIENLNLKNSIAELEIDYNSQLYLVMQDMSSPRFLVRLSQAIPTSKSSQTSSDVLVRPPGHPVEKTGRPKKP